MPTDLLAGASGVLFDLDDTLLDYSTARDTAVQGWAAGLGVVVSGAELIDLWRHLEELHFARYSLGELTVHEQRRARVRGLPGLDRLTDDEADATFSEFMGLTEQHWRPVPGTADAVRRIARRVPVGVLTNGVEQVQARKLAHVGLADLPLFASVATGVPKPQPGAFVRACRGLGSEAATTVMVGDNLDADVRGALAAGLRAIWVNATDREVPAGVASIRSVAELR